MAYKIIPFVGFDKVKFGIKMDELIKIMGNPSEIEKDNRFSEEDDDTADIVFYDEIGFSAMFEKVAEGRLSEMDFEGEDFVLEDQVKIGMDKDEVLKILEQKGYDEPTQEDLEDELEEGDTTEAYTYDEKNITLWFTEGKLDTIQLSPEMFDADTIKWPE